MKYSARKAIFEKLDTDTLHTIQKGLEALENIPDFKDAWAGTSLFDYLYMIKNEIMPIRLAALLKSADYTLHPRMVNNNS